MGIIYFFKIIKDKHKKKALLFTRTSWLPVLAEYPY